MTNLCQLCSRNRVDNEGDGIWELGVPVLISTLYLRLLNIEPKTKEIKGEMPKWGPC